MDPLSLTTTAYQPLELQIFPGLPRRATDFSNKFAPASPDLPPVCQDPKTFVKENGTFQQGGRIHKNPSFINGIYKSDPSTIHLTKELWQGHGNSIPESHLLTAVIRTNKNLAPCLTARRGYVFTAASNKSCPVARLLPSFKCRICRQVAHECKHLQVQHVKFFEKKTCQQSSRIPHNHHSKLQIQVATNKA